MTKIILATLIAVSFSAFAADAEKSDSTTVDHSKNPMTGTQKTKVTHKSKKKGMDGDDVTTKKTETTKVHKDGKVEKETETKTDSESK